MKISDIAKTAVPETSGRRSRGEFTGYYELLLAVLVQAVDDYIRGDYRSQRVAKDFLFGTGGEGLFSLSSICSYFNLNVSEIRAGVDRAKLNRSKWEEGRKSLFYRGPGAEAAAEIYDEDVSLEAF